MKILGYAIPWIEFRTLPIDWEGNLAIGEQGIYYTGFCADVLLMSWLGWSLAVYRGKVRLDFDDVSVVD